MPLPLLSVSQLTRYLKERIDKDINLQNLWIKGEISNYKRHSSGHIYFTLKDAESTLPCVMFRGKALFLKFEPAHGMQVLAGGCLSIYERDGRYQLYVENLQPAGIGALSIAYEQLKEKLAAEGLFDARWKKNLPLLPRRVGIVTSPTGAALADIVSVSKRRFSGIQLILSPVLVQGELAPAQIVQAIELMNRVDDIDVLIVGRGGGSLEELWAFNDERVVRAIFASRIPVISAVGHETDYSLADFAADRRAPTPSAAAEMAVPDRRELAKHLSLTCARLVRVMQERVREQRRRLQRATESKVFRHPRRMLDQSKQYVDVLNLRLIRAFQTLTTARSHKFTKQAEKLAVLNPLAVLRRGYSIARSYPQRRIIKTIGAITPGEEIEVILADGTLLCRVEATQREEVEDDREKA
ncbi:MAG TPA: exodeoxyribonuclease VII large subunit [Negativicutes bacterium]|nr:exodeoxyribonuclease VII large subunit [Negativicutes bacterium]